MSNEHNNAPAVPQGWRISKTRLDGREATIVNGPGGGCVACKDADIPRVVPESILYDLATTLLTATPAPAPAQEFNKSVADAEIKALYVESQGSDKGWLGIEGSYFIGGVVAARKQKAAPAPAQEVATLSLSAEDVHAAFAKNFPKSRISQAWINFAADIAQAIAARAAKPAQEPMTTAEVSARYRFLMALLIDRGVLTDRRYSNGTWSLQGIALVDDSGLRGAGRTPEEAIDNAIEMARLNPNDQLTKWRETHEQIAQEVGLTEAERVMCLIASGCIGTVKMTYDSGPYEITRTSINSDRLIDSVIAALRAKGGKL